MSGVHDLSENLPPQHASTQTTLPRADHSPLLRLCARGGPGGKATLCILLSLFIACRAPSPSASSPDATPPAAEAPTTKTPDTSNAPPAADALTPPATPAPDTSPSPTPDTTEPPPDMLAPARPAFPAFGSEQPYALATLETEHTRDIPGDGPLFAIFDFSAGSVRCRLYEEWVPRTVDHFVGLARGRIAWRFQGKPTQRPLYDGLTIHRIEPGLWIQGGDPTDTGSGRLGFKFNADADPRLRFNQPGVLGLVQPWKGAAGSQFFITLAPLPALDGRYPVFGLCDNLDVLQHIATSPTLPGTQRPTTPILIEQLRFER